MGKPHNIYVWIIGGVLLLVVGWFGWTAVFSQTGYYQLTLIDAPKEVPVGGVATFTWRIDGPGTTINHTSVHLGTVSNPGELGQEVKPVDTKYTMLVADFADGKYDIPLQFIGNIAMPTTPTTYYYRVHALVKDKNYWSDEYTLELKPVEHKVTLLDAPKATSSGSIVTFTWRVDGPPTTINHTSVHFGTESNPGTLGKDVAPADTKYKDLVKDYTKGNYDIPLQFVGNTRIDEPGTYFFRAHAIIEGKNFWTDEYTLEVKGKVVPVSPSP